MRKKRITVVLLLALMFVLALPANSFAAKNGLNKTNVKLTVGSSIQLKLKCKKGKVKWSSSKKSVATVSKKGKVKARKKGTAYITAKVRGKKYRCKVKVVSPTVGFDYTAYLKLSRNCQVGNNKIKILTDKLTAAETTDRGKATAIYNYVRDNIDTVTYNQEGLEFWSDHNFIYGNESHYGAVGTLNEKAGNDSDQAHLLIAMLRTAGIPARYCFGSCRFGGKTLIMANILGSNYMDHVWAECALNDQWIVLDPTREAESYAITEEDFLTILFTDNEFGKINTWNYNDYKLHGYYASLPF